MKSGGAYSAGGVPCAEGAIFESAGSTDDRDKQASRNDPSHDSTMTTASRLRQPAAAVVVLLLWVASALRALSWAALLFMVVANFAAYAPTWSWEYRGGYRSVWSRFRDKNYIKYHLDADKTGQALWGWDVQSVLLLWFPVVVAAVFSCVAEAIDTALIRSDKQDRQKPAGIAAKLRMKVTMLATRPMPGQQFWLYWCDGLNLAEFLSALLWIVTHILLFWDFMRYYSKESKAVSKIGIRMRLPVSVLRLEWMSYTFAWLAMVDMALLFLPISHNSFLHYLTGLPYSALIRFHRWLGHSTLWMVWLHGIFFYFFWIADPKTNFWQEFFDWGNHSFINIFAGTISGVFGLALWVTSINWVRRNYFEVFYKTHIIGFIGFVAFGMMHYNWIWTCLVPGLALYAGDIVLRVVQSQTIAVVSAVYVTRDHNMAVFDVPVSQEVIKCPMQELFVMIPGISRWQWHPFSVMAHKPARDGKPSVATVAMKSYGHWTKAAIKHLASGSLLPMRVTGALDGVSLGSLAGYDQLVLVAGGVGVTPFFNLLDAMINTSSNHGPQNVQLIWTVRSPEELAILPLDILAAARDEGWLDLSLFCTGKMLDNAPLDIKPVLDQQPDGDVKTVDSDHSIGKLHNNATTFSGISAFFWDVARPAHPKFWGANLSPLYNAAVVIFAFAGALLGLIAAQPAGLEVDTEQESYYYKYGIAILVGITVQSIGLPMILVVFPTNLISYIKSTATVALPHGPASLDGAVVKGKQVGYPEAGLFAEIKAGRPDLESTLQAAISDTSNKQIAVMCAGPQGLIHSTAMLVHKFNSSMKEGQPLLHFEKHAYEL